MRVGFDAVVKDAIDPSGSSSAALPARIGEYDVVRRIGEGGMGVVYEASERLTGRRVALKVLNAALAGSEDARQRFVTEMTVLSKLDHPSVVRYLSAFESEGQLVMVLELLSGRTLRQELEARGRLPYPRALQIAAEITAGLVAAHEGPSPVVHRDLKPENVMLLRDDAVKVMDFGIAKVLGDEQRRTQASQLVGTVQYMSPEQIEGRPVTTATDLYALGLVLYEMLGGQPPFAGSSLRELLRQQCEAPPPPLAEEVLDEVPAALVALLGHLLAKDPAARPSSAREVLSALAALRSASTPARAAPGASGVSGVSEGKLAEPPPRAKAELDTLALVDRFEGKRAGKRRWLAPVVGLAVLALGAVGVAAYSRSSSAPPRASAARASASDPGAPGQAAPPASSSSARAEGGDRFVTWTVPAAWREERSPSALGVARFVLPRVAGDAEDAIVDVVAPAAEVAAVHRNAERAFDLCSGCKTTTAMTVDTATVTVLDLRGASWFPYVSGQTGKAPKPGFELVVAVVPIDKTGYIFRMLGPEPSVKAARADYDAFLASVRRR